MPKQHAPNPAREAARALARSIGNMSDEQRKAAAPSLPIVSIEGRSLSPVNAIMVSRQAPTATVIGGFRQWLKAGRCVRKGEHGIFIWVPTTYKGPGVNILTGAKVEEMEETRFILAPVFDVSQTAELEATADAA